MGNQFLEISFFSLFISFLGFSAQSANPSDVVINEIAWMGTEVSYNDEWIELRNNTSQEISLDGWTLKAADGTPEIKLTGSYPVNGFYLLERTDDNTVPEIAGDQIYTGALGNNSEILELYDNLGNLINRVDASSGWPTGDNTTKQTMEKTSSGWQTSQNAGGTPKSENSKLADVGFPPVGASLAAISEPIQQNRNNSVLFLAAAFTSFFSGVIILILKKKLKLK